MPFQGRGSDFSLHCLVRKVLIPLKSVPDGPGLRFGSDTRAHCLNTGQLSSRCGAAYFSIGWLYMATFQLPSRASNGLGVTLTRAHRDSDCLNLNTGQLELSSCCLFLNRLAVRRHIAGSNLCFPARLPPNPSGCPARPGPATAWPKGLRRWTLDTSDQVRLHQKITRHIPS